ncbi:hypothetical protein GFJ94_11735 [Flavobacterium sp. LMO8]|uniref:hypothetical protein n=1 Tax=Flavobacterium sp. LMO8 TaxID=2654244 RepID=UPI0012910E52|nr:hypothetical protein [Flavobacterium sp. LMO8]MQP25734.1 hypothetical protein [Flavobacterium sp. LMO8]
MLKKLYVLLLLFFSIVSNGNMANPYFDGSKHSTILSSKKISVKKEKIKIVVYEGVATLHITYFIESDKAGKLPLLFLAKDLRKEALVKMNGVTIEKQYYSYDSPFFKEYGISTVLNDSEYNLHFKFDKETEFSENIMDVFLFEAHLKKGSNVIEVTYKANLGSNTYGYTQNYDFEYLLYPSKYWKEFGTITIDVTVPKDYNLTNLSHKLASSNQNNYHFQINQNYKDFKFKMVPEISGLSEFLIAIGPLKFALFIATLLYGLFIYLTIKIRKKLLSKLKIILWKLVYSIILTITFYFAYYIFYDLVKVTIGKNGLCNFYDIFLITLPLFAIGFIIIIFITDALILKRMNKNAV